MNALRRARSDPWWDDGTGARRARTKRRALSVVAFGIAIVACGLTVAAWVQTILPLVAPHGIG